MKEHTKEELDKFSKELRAKDSSFRDISMIFEEVIAQGDSLTGFLDGGAIHILSKIRKMEEYRRAIDTSKLKSAVEKEGTLSFIKYINDKNGIEMMYPVPWNIREYGDHFEFISPVQNYLAVYVVPDVKKTFETITLDEVFRKFSKADNEFYKDYDLIENKTIQGMLEHMRDLPVHKEVFEYSDSSSRKIRILAYKIIYKDTLYNILFYGDEPVSYNNYLPIVDKMIGSFRLTKYSEAEFGNAEKLPKS